MSDSWWLKVKRAQHHMVEIRRYARVYADSKPYQVVPVRPQPKGYPDSWFCTLQIVRQPDPMIALILGDFIHNLRSALDHMVVACAPRKQKFSANMPIQLMDPWERDASGRLLIVNREARKKYRTATAGIDKRAEAIVRGFQPYHMSLEERDRHGFGIISRLENADKHRQLITVGSGVERAVYSTWVKSGGGLVLIKQSDATIQGNFAHDGAQQQIIFTPGTRPRDSEMQMNCQGSAVITIKITRVGGIEPPSDFPLFSTMLGQLYSVRSFLRLMEPFVIR